MSDYSKNILKGESYEKIFADFLNNHGLSFIYINQGPQHEHHSIIKEYCTENKIEYLKVNEIESHLKSLETTKMA